MSYDDIIAEIKSNLTGNKDNDKDYIINQFRFSTQRKSIWNLADCFGI